MPKYRVCFDVIYGITIEAESEDDACRIAVEKSRNGRGEFIADLVTNDSDDPDLRLVSDCWMVDP